MWEYRKNSVLNLCVCVCVCVYVCVCVCVERDYTWKEKKSLTFKTVYKLHESNEPKAKGKPQETTKPVPSESLSEQVQ